MTAAGTPGLPVETQARHAGLLLPVLASVGLLISLVSSLGAPLIPTIATAYHVSVSTAQWSLTICLIAGAVSTPLVSKLGDGPRRRMVITATLGLTSLGGVLAAIPAPFWCLLAGRTLQGFALGLLPVVMSVARDHLPRERARRALATLSVTAAAGVGLGYPLTGVLTEDLSFRGAFGLAAALSLAAVVVAAAVVPPGDHRSPVKIDPSGAGLLMIGLGALLLALSQAERWGWGSARYVVTTAGGLAVLGWWVRHEWRSPAPTVDIRLMRTRSVCVANVVGLFAGIGMYLLLSLIIRYVQTPASTGYGLGASVVVAGFILIPFSVLTVSASRLVPLMTRFVDDGWVIPIGCGAFLAAMLIFRFERSQFWELCVVMGLAGLGVGYSFAALPRLIMRAVPAGRTSSALGVNQVLRSIGFSIGSALSGTVLDGYGHGVGGYPGTAGYNVAISLGAGIWLTTGMISYLFARPGRAAAALTVPGPAAPSATSSCPGCRPAPRAP